MSARHPVQGVLQRLATYLIREDGLSWQLESFNLRDNALGKPHLTAETIVFGHDVRLCARQWGTEFRIALRITHGPNRSSAPDGRRAPPERQQEPNVVTPAVVISLLAAESLAATGGWSEVITALFGQAQNDLITLTEDLEKFLAARTPPAPKYDSETPQD